MASPLFNLLNNGTNNGFGNGMANNMMNGNMNGNGFGIFGNFMNLISQFNQFEQNFQGDAKQQVQDLLNSGQMSQSQFNQFAPLATQFQNMLRMFRRR